MRRLHASHVQECMVLLCHKDQAMLHMRGGDALGDCGRVLPEDAESPCKVDLFDTMRDSCMWSAFLKPAWPG